MLYLVMGDNHLRPDTPLCRLDTDWIATQRAELDFIVERANAYGADIICTGDLYDVPRVPPKIVSMFIDAMVPLQGRCYIIAGNHSLPWHKQENLMDSSMGILSIIGKENPKIVYLECEDKTADGRFEHMARLPYEDGVLLIHTLAFPKLEDIPFGADATSSYALLEAYPEASIIFTGDYHHKYITDYDGRYVVNPGCMNVQAADMIGYQPSVYLVNTGDRIDVTTQKDKYPVFRLDGFSTMEIPIPGDPAMLTRNHLDQQKERDARISSFVETITHKGQIGLSFEDNLRSAIIENNIAQDIKDILAEVEEEMK